MISDWSPIFLYLWRGHKVSLIFVNIVIMQKNWRCNNYNINIEYVLLSSSTHQRRCWKNKNRPSKRRENSKSVDEIRIVGREKQRPIIASPNQQRNSKEKQNYFPNRRICSNSCFKYRLEWWELFLSSIQVLCTLVRSLRWVLHMGDGGSQIAMRNPIIHSDIFRDSRIILQIFKKWLITTMPGTLIAGSRTLISILIPDPI